MTIIRWNQAYGSGHRDAPMFLKKPNHGASGPGHDVEADVECEAFARAQAPSNDDVDPRATYGPGVWESLFHI